MQLYATYLVLNDVILRETGRCSWWGLVVGGTYMRKKPQVIIGTKFAGGFIGGVVNWEREKANFFLGGSSARKVSGPSGSALAPDAVVVQKEGGWP